MKLPSENYPVLGKHRVDLFYSLINSQAVEKIPRIDIVSAKCRKMLENCNFAQSMLCKAVLPNDKIVMVEVYFDGTYDVIWDFETTRKDALEELAFFHF